MVDDATDEPKSVTSGRVSQHRRRWPSAAMALWLWRRLWLVPQRQHQIAGGVVVVQHDLHIRKLLSPGQLDGTLDRLKIVRLGTIPTPSRLTLRNTAPFPGSARTPAPSLSLSGCGSPPLRGHQARTSITELSVPCWFQTFSWASRSGIHSPSRTNLYS